VEALYLDPKLQKKYPQTCSKVKFPEQNFQFPTKVQPCMKGYLPLKKIILSIRYINLVKISAFLFYNRDWTSVETNFWHFLKKIFEFFRKNPKRIVNFQNLWNSNESQKAFLSPIPVFWLIRSSSNDFGHFLNNFL
jgi:hypothetical protein